MTTAVVGYVDKSILVEVDGDEIAVGLVTVPVTLTAPNSGDVVGCVIDAKAGTPAVSIDPDEAHDCPGDISVPAYLRSGDDRMSVGDLACCVECRPALTG